MMTMSGVGTVDSGRGSKGLWMPDRHRELFLLFANIHFFTMTLEGSY